MKKLSFKPIVFMIILTVIYTGILASINEVTKERIELNEEIQEKAAFLYALDIELPPKDASTIHELYNQHIKKINIEGKTIYEAYKGEELTGYLLPIEGDAVWGTLRGIMAVSPDFKDILGIDFLSHNETPGLGGRIDEKDFKEQFRNITIDLDNQEEFIFYSPHPDAQVDAISGATGTSNAVRRILNNNLEFYIREIKGGL